WLHGKRYNGIVEFPDSGSVTATLTSAKSETLSVRLDLISTTTPALRLQLIDAGNPVEVDCLRFLSGLFLVDYIGRYNLKLSQPQNSKEGYAIVVVKPTGMAKLTGYLPHGHPWSVGTNLTEGGKVPIAARNRKGDPLFSGE